MPRPMRETFRLDYLGTIATFLSCALILAIFGYKRAPAVSCPDARAILIGDVHGCHSELQTLLRRLKPDVRCDTIYFLGDVIGKGPKSLEALRTVRALTQASPFVESLMGNHEAGFLRWLDARTAGKPLPPTSNELDRKQWAKLLSAEELAWIRRRPLQLALPPEYGSVVAVHAGMRPGVAPSFQTRDELLTIRSLMMNGTGSPLPGKRGPQGGWASHWRGPPHLVFGHDARRKLQKHMHATGIDTGVVYGGKLTALVLRTRNASMPGPPSLLYGGSLLQVPAHKGSCAKPKMMAMVEDGVPNGNKQNGRRGRKARSSRRRGAARADKEAGARRAKEEREHPKTS